MHAEDQWTTLVATQSRVWRRYGCFAGRRKVNPLGLAAQRGQESNEAVWADDRGGVVAQRVEEKP